MQVRDERVLMSLRLPRSLKNKIDIESQTEYRPKNKVVERALERYFGQKECQPPDRTATT